MLRWFRDRHREASPPASPSETTASPLPSIRSAAALSSKTADGGLENAGRESGDRQRQRVTVDGGEGRAAMATLLWSSHERLGSQSPARLLRECPELYRGVYHFLRSLGLLDPGDVPHDRVSSVHDAVVRCCAFSPDGSRLATASYDHSGKIWAVSGPGSEFLDRRQQTQKPLLTLVCPSDLWCCAFSRDGKLLALGCEDGCAHVFRADDGEVVAKARHNGWVLSCAWSPDGSCLATAGTDSAIVIWDTKTWSSMVVLKTHTDNVDCVSFSWDGSFLLSCSHDLRMLPWRVQGGLWVPAITSPAVAHHGPVYSARFSHDGALVACASGDKTVSIWTASDWTLQTQLFGHTDTVHGACFSPDDRMIATASVDGTVRIWSTADGVELTALRQHKNVVCCVDWSSDWLLCSCSVDRSYCLYDLSFAKTDDPTGEFWDYK